MWSTPTSYGLDLPRLFASSQEDNVSLRIIDILILNIEQLIYSIFLECTEFHKQSNRTCERLFDDKVLFPRHLRKSDHAASYNGNSKGEGTLTYTFEQLEQISPGFVRDILRVDGRNWRHYILICLLKQGRQTTDDGGGSSEVGDKPCLGRGAEPHTARELSRVINSSPSNHSLFVLLPYSHKLV